MKRLFLCAFLASCGQQPGADGYSFEGPEYERSPVTMHVVTHENLTDLRRAADEAGALVGHDRDLMAWSAITRDGSVCTIHIVDPVVSYKPEWIGHEAAHCLFGQWHR